MNTPTGNANSTKMIWTGRVISGLVILFFLLDGVLKLFRPVQVVEATVGLGFNESVIVGLGLTAIACALFYLIPRTAVLGAILLTGYLGGAVAVKVRIGAPLFDIGFALSFGVLVWLGLFLRDRRLRSLLPLTQAQ
jgi:hypothetical protein